jgi:hypothetical protein
MADTVELQAYDALARHPRLSDMVALVVALAKSALESHPTTWCAPDEVKSLAEERRLSHDDAVTEMGDALRVLDVGPRTLEEHALTRALWAHAVAERRPKSAQEADPLARETLWLAVHTPLDATMLLDRALGDDADELWGAIARRVGQIDDRRNGSRLQSEEEVEPTERCEALVGAAALVSSSSPAAATRAALLSTLVTDPALACLLRREPRPRGSDLEGEVLYVPRGVFGTTVMAITGVLFAMHIGRLLARAALGYRKPARVTISQDGARIRWKTEILGRTIRDHDVVFGREGLASVVREVRYPRTAFYAGLFFLALGSFVGMRTVADSVRSASPPLFLTGFVFVALGIVLDFALGSLVPGAGGRCRLVFVPRAGAPVFVAGVDAAQADAALALLATAPR